ncbi:MAG: hypothetical protein ACRDVC_02080 [Acidimicrobiales bacterium]
MAILAISLCPLLLDSTVVGASGVVVPPQNPASDIWAVPAYTFTPKNDHSYALPACWTRNARGTYRIQTTKPQCVRDELAATNRAQGSEGLGDITLPTNFAGLSAPDQMLVLTDIERVSRGETPVLGVSSLANTLAQQGALERTDPTLSPTVDIAGMTGAFGSNYAAGVNTLDANYEWMYTDGWDAKYTFNGACTSPSSSGCWGHRDNILINDSRMPCDTSSCSIIMGGGYVHLGSESYNTYTELFVQTTGVTPVLTYTWQEALAAGASP